MLSGCEKTTRCFRLQLLVMIKVFRFILILFSLICHADMTKGQELWRGGVMGPASSRAVQVLVYVVFFGLRAPQVPLVLQWQKNGSGAGWQTWTLSRISPQQVQSCSRSRPQVVDSLASRQEKSVVVSTRTPTFSFSGGRFITNGRLFRPFRNNGREVVSMRPVQPQAYLLCTRVGCGDDYRGGAVIVLPTFSTRKRPPSTASFGFNTRLGQSGQLGSREAGASMRGSE